MLNDGWMAQLSPEEVGTLLIGTPFLEYVQLPAAPALQPCVTRLQPRVPKLRPHAPRLRPDA